MICSRCHSPTVTWRGPLSALTHTECSNCGGMNCQQIEDDIDHDPGDHAAELRRRRCGLFVLRRVRLR